MLCEESVELQLLRTWGLRERSGLLIAAIRLGNGRMRPHHLWWFHFSVGWQSAAAAFNRFECLLQVAIGAGLLLNPVVLISEYYLKTTGKGLPEGPGDQTAVSLCLPDNNSGLNELQAACTEQRKALATWWSLALSSGASQPSCGLALASPLAQQACWVQWKGCPGSLL